jgi:hypothetical protein
MSKYTYRLRAPRGLDNTLIKELQEILGVRVGRDAVRKIPGRKAVEVRGDVKMMWDIMFKSRIAEDLQVKITQSFSARGEEELRTSLQKLPWSAYLPMKNYEQFRLPPTRAASHKSNLFHTQLVREVLLQEINDLPIRRDHAKYAAKNDLTTSPIGFKKFKKNWIKDRDEGQKKTIEKQAKQEIKELKKELVEEKFDDLDPESLEVFIKSDNFKALDQSRKEYLLAAQLKQKNLKP